MALIRKPSDILLAVPVIGSAEWLGGESYIRNLLYALAALPPQERPRVRLTNVLMANAESLAAYMDSGVAHIHPLVRFALRNRVTKLAFRIFNRGLRMVKGEEFSIELHDADIIYPMMNFVPGGKRIMYWIGDFQEIYLPHFFSEDQLKARHVKNRSIVESDQMLVLSSKAALDDLRDNFKTVNAPIRIWRFCSLLPAQPAGVGDLSSLDLPGKFAYLPNQFWVHKNHAVVFRALARLKERGVVIPLVCTGSPQDKRAPGYFSSLTEIIREAGMSEQIRILGIVPKAQQIEIIRRAAFIVQPSLFEGWSTVVEDAKSLGRPIVLSNLAVHREQDPPNALFFDPNDVDDVAGKLQEAWIRFAPGPDPEAEKQAAVRLAERRRQSAREFINILVEAVAMSADSAARIRG